MNLHENQQLVCHFYVSEKLIVMTCLMNYFILLLRLQLGKKPGERWAGKMEGNIGVERWRGMASGTRSHCGFRHVHLLIWRTMWMIDVS